MRKIIIIIIITIIIIIIIVIIIIIKIIIRIIIIIIIAIIIITIQIIIKIIIIISYLPKTAITPGSAADLAATRKLVKYEDLSQRYAFVLIAIESHGTFSKSVLDFLHELGLRATTVTLEPRETSFLFQHLSFAIHRFIAVCFAKTFVIN